MAVVSNTCNGSWGHECKIYLEYKINSQNIANNTSNITLHLYGQTTTSNPGAYNFNNNCKAKIQIDGVNKKSSNSLNMDFRDKNKVEMLTWTGNVTHNSDGTLKIKIYGWFDTNGPSSITTGEVSYTWTLTTIPRTSKVSLSSANFNIGTTITINTNRASTSFTHTAVITYNGKTIRTQKNIGASYSWNTTELYAAIPNGKSATGEVVLTTYSGSSNIGSSKVTFTATVTNSNPTFTDFEATDCNTKTYALTGNNTYFIKKYSKLRVRIPYANRMVAKNSATPSYYNIVAGSASVTADYSESVDGVWKEISNVNANTVSVFAIDSRENQTSVTKSLKIINYSECLIQSLKIDRKDGVGESAIITMTGKYSTTNFGAVTNDLKTIQLRHKAKGTSTWSSWINIVSLITKSNGTFSCVDKVIPNITFTLGTEYDIQVQINDELSDDDETAVLNSGKVLMSAVKDQGVCFGGIYDLAVAGALQGVLDDTNIDMIKHLFVTQTVQEATADLNNYNTTGVYYFPNTVTITNIPAGVNGWLLVINGKDTTYKFTKQLWFRAGTKDTNDYHNFCRTSFDNGATWSTWAEFMTSKHIVDNLTSTNTIRPLSANQGRILNNKINPVGSVIMTATNTNPSKTYGGTWILTDKELAPAYFNSGFTVKNANSSGLSFQAMVSGHTVTVMLDFEPTVNLTDSTIDIGTINFNQIGITRLPVTIHTSGFSDGGNCMILFNINYSSGLVQSVDINGKTDNDTYVSSGQTCKLFFTCALSHDYMIDRFCNKFIWERTA